MAVTGDAQALPEAQDGRQDGLDHLGLALLGTSAASGPAVLGDAYGDVGADQSEVENRLAAWVRTRPRGTTPTAAVRDGVLSALAQGDPTLGLSKEADAFWHIVDESSSLRARTREIAERSEAALAAALAEEAAPGDPLPRLLAGALAGTFRAVVAEIRRKLAAGEEIEAVRAEVTAAAGRMFAALDRVSEDL
ncbi:hypothetical protein ABIA35_007116 [Catenulispora sp. MAP12-49]|uniref:TetR family transcriptional regulator n=1 Tax=Catenulispora sp. MAP12-49 TaxID=3156302 RepID=UPI003518D3AC